MDAFSIIVTVGLVLFVIFICLVLFVYIPYVIHFVGFLAKLLAAPFVKLWDKIKPALQKNKTPEEKEALNSKFSVCGGAVGFWTLIAVAVLSVFSTLFVLYNVDGKADLLIEVVGNTVMGAFLLSVSGALTTEITPAWVLAVGVSAGVSLLFMKAVSKGKWYVKIGMYVFSFMTMVAMAIGLNDVFEFVGKWGIDMMQELSNQDGKDIFLAAGRICVLIVLGYITILLILSVVEQVLSLAAFAPISLVIFFLLVALASAVGNKIGLTAAAQQTVSNVLVFILIFGVDILRDNYEGIQKRVKPYIDRIFRKGMRKITG